MRPGDVALVRTSGLIGRAIRLVTRSPFNHVRLVVSPAGLVLEANPTGAEWGTVKPGDVIFSPPLTDTQRERLRRAPYELAGKPYGFLDVAALGLAQLGVRLPFVRRRIANPRTLFCSQLVDEAWRRVGFEAFTDGRTPLDVTPGDLARLAEAEGWPTVHH